MLNERPRLLACAVACGPGVFPRIDELDFWQSKFLFLDFLFDPFDEALVGPNSIDFRLGDRCKVYRDRILDAAIAKGLAKREDLVEVWLDQ